VKVFSWYEPHRMGEIAEELSKGIKVKDDLSLEQQLVRLRSKLTDEEVIRIQNLALETATAIEETAFCLKQGETEYQIASRLSANCIKRGIEPIVNLVAADDRVYKRRHPLPTGQVLQEHALIVVCGRRMGQIVSASRLVHFGQLSEDLRLRHQAVTTVDAMLINKTRPGVSLAKLFEEMKQAYQKVGFAEEWMNHHQGGLSGYQSREQLLLPSSQLVVEARQVYAWNPSIAGVKSEDTILIGEHGNQILTQTGQYPMIEISYEDVVVQRPDILIR
ncbi:MAG TPA: M24 family metallopeptidase, partial [Bacillota bacterium]|nr:M24 family metallopeptidase [Bacillota bacterium]